MIPKLILGADLAYGNDSMSCVVIATHYCAECKTSFDCDYNYYQHRKLVHVEFEEKGVISLFQVS